MIGLKSDRKYIIREQNDCKYKGNSLQIHAFFIQKPSFSPIFMCQELDDRGGGHLLRHGRLLYIQSNLS